MNDDASTILHLRTQLAMANDDSACKSAKIKDLEASVAKLQGELNEANKHVEGLSINCGTLLSVVENQAAAICKLS